MTPRQLLNVGRVRVRRLPGGGRECLAYCRSCAWRAEGWPEWHRVGWLHARWLRLRCDACGRALCAQPSHDHAG
jgi:hypothetical protein